MTPEVGKVFSGEGTKEFRLRTWEDLPGIREAFLGRYNLKHGYMPFEQMAQTEHMHIFNEKGRATSGTAYYPATPAA